MFNKFTDFIEILGEKYIYNLHTGAIDILEDDFDYNKCKEDLEERLYLDDDYYRQYCKEEMEGNINQLYTSDRIYIAYSNLCNAKCKYCFENTLIPQDYNCNMDVIFEELNKINTPVIPITLYGGEPLLKQNYMYNEKMFQYAETKNLKLNIITNGFNIDYYIELLKKYKDCINVISLSIDGNKEYHDKIKGKGFYDKIFTCLNNINELNFKINFKLNISKENICYLNDFILDVNNLNLANSSISVNSIKYTDKGLTLLELYKIYEDIRKKTDKKISVKINNLYINRINNIFSDSAYWLPTKMCDEMKVKLITDKGVFVCNETLYNNEFNIENYKIRKFNYKCETCKYEKICGGGCMMLNSYNADKNCMFDEIEIFLQFYIRSIVEHYG